MAVASSLTRFDGETVLLVGAGAPAAALVARLLDAGARVRWLSQDLDIAEEIGVSHRPDRIEIAFREPRAQDFAPAAAVIVAMGDPLATRVAAQARALDRPVVVLGRPDLSTFDLDGSDGPGDAAAWRPHLGAPLRRAGAWLSAHLRGATGAPGSFGA